MVKDLVYYLEILGLLMDEKLICVVLTGGKSSRMNNQNKSFLKIKEINFIENIVNSLKEKTSLLLMSLSGQLALEKFQL